MPIGKKRTREQIAGERGVEILKCHLPVEWVVREYHPDYGIDLSVELFERGKTAITTGAHIFFQVKACAHLDQIELEIQNRSNVEKPHIEVAKESYKLNAIRYTLDTDFIATVERMGSGVPVILSVIDLETQNVYFLCITDYIEKILIHDKDYRIQRTKTVYIPTDNKLTEDTWSVIEWYAKRPRFYALFNKIHYQNSELKFTSQYDLGKTIDHFIHILRRFDVWDKPTLFPYMNDIKAEMDYYTQHGITKFAEERIKEARQRGMDVDSEIWEADGCDPNRDVSFREVQKVQGLHLLWSKLENLGNLFEDVYKEAYLPTALWCAMKPLGY